VSNIFVFHLSISKISGNAFSDVLYILKSIWKQIAAYTTNNNDVSDVVVNPTTMQSRPRQPPE
jgi:hypothetical protein